MTVLVDSDILIEITRGRNAALLQRWEALSATDSPILYSPVSAAELWAGARPSEHGFLKALFQSLTCVPVTEAVGRRAGDYIRAYRKSHSVELADALIAASAVLNDAALWTHNRKHYPMPELSVF